MKKFLFTLAALLMVGSLSAEEYFYMENFEVPASALGASGSAGRVNVNVKAHFEAYVSAWQVWFTLPDGLTIQGHRAGADLTLAGHDDFGDPKTFTPNLKVSPDKLSVIVACDESDYSEDGDYYGCMKWAPGDYDQMWIVVFNAAADFAGGEITIATEPACGSDERPEVVPCERNQHNETTLTVTVEGAEPQNQDFAGQIVFGDVTEDGLLPVSYNGEEEYTITITLNGEPVELVDGCVQLIEGNNIVTVTISAEGYNDLTATYEGEWAPVVPEVTEKPTINVVDDPEAQTVTVTATGNGHIIIYWDDMPQAEGEGTAVWVIPYGDDPEGEEYGVSATAQEEGKEVSEYALETVFVPGKTVTPQPYETPAPEVNVVTDAEAEVVTITATGEGTVIIYVNYFDGNGPQAVATGEGEVTFEIPFGEEVAYVGVWATAQADEEALVGLSETEYVEIPAKEVGPGPEDPHMVGYWLVMVQADGTEEFVQLNLGANGDYITAYDVIYPLYYNVGNFYFMIDGVAYGAAADGTEANLGDSMQNPLTADNTNTYFVYNGYSYSIGVHLVTDENGDVVDYTAYVAKGGPVSVDELVNGKTVAGVRYYNLAGQEMQEANGMTIVVTTYTDGTTSAVKVMK